MLHQLDFYFIGVHEMLPSFIIEEIRRKEERRRQNEQQPYLDLPIPELIPGPQEDSDNGPLTIIIELV